MRVLWLLKVQNKWQNLGENSKMVITGDITQIDLPSKNKSGLIDAIDNLKKIKDISEDFDTGILDKKAAISETA